MNFVAKTFLGLEEVLAQELQNLGAQNIMLERRAVTFSGDLALMYRANLCLRTASRILKTIKVFDAKDADEIYREVKKMNWEDYMSVNQTFLINSTVYSETFKHSQFVAYRVKDAIADFFADKYDNRRPSVRLTNPDVIIDVHISHNTCSISLDSSGESLHKRGYRITQMRAPINEALAAGMLLLAGWNGQFNLIDPMCGSGTLLIEAALIALNIPPGIFRKHFQFEQWKDFDRELFDEIYNDDSFERAFPFKIYGFDIVEKAVEVAQENIRAAGLSRYIELKKASVADFELPQGAAMIVANPPYGERLKSENLEEIYQQLGATLKHRCAGINAWVISSNIDCLQKIGLKPSFKIKLMNGDLPCEYWKFEIFDGKRNDFVASRSRFHHDNDREERKPRFQKNEKIFWKKDDDNARKQENENGRIAERKFEKRGEKKFDRKDRNFEKSDRKFNDRKPPRNFNKPNF
ncbi:MAG: THUMP domain-containing protein [Prevotellaceae bacterium]|jgi:putative N6-adenine-specific DNA methylase|nr:THUMP domain-containing protein [Prevotellaceae bacterium]